MLGGSYLGETTLAQYYYDPTETIPQDRHDARQTWASKEPARQTWAAPTADKRSIFRQKPEHRI